MGKVKIVSIIGARPQFIKLARLSPLLKKTFKEIIVHTGQHYDKEMSERFFAELSLPKPHYNLGIRLVNQGEQIGRMLLGIEKALIKERPRAVVVYGDTNSTLAGALAAAKLNVPVIHIEAGLRSFNRTMPEEINRVITDHIASFLFCPTQTAVRNLQNEGITKNVFLVGDVMYDNLRNFLSSAQDNCTIIRKLNLRPKNYFLLTIHRAENTTDKARLRNILSYFDSIEKTVIFPIHPRTKKILGNSFSPKGNLRFITSVSYLEMLILQKNAKMIFTDSGGIQKEAYILKVPCLSLRQETEWVETLQGNCNILVGLDTKKIQSALNNADAAKRYYKRGIFGNGKASEQIYRIIRKYLR